MSNLFEFNSEKLKKRGMTSHFMKLIGEICPDLYIKIIDLLTKSQSEEVVAWISAQSKEFQEAFNRWVD